MQMDRVGYYWKHATAEAVGEKHGVSHEELTALAPRIVEITARMQSERKAGGLRYRNLPYDGDMVDSLNREIEHFRDRCDVLVVLGIGGSALGNIALHSALNPYTYNFHSDRTRSGPQLFVLDNVDPDQLRSVVDYITPKLKKTIVNVISKSGETMETSAQFILFCDLLQKKLGKRYRENVIVTTDPASGALREMSRAEGYRTLDVPEGVGGRFSVLSPAGLFAAGVCGLDIEALMAGAQDMDKRCKVGDVMLNPAALNAAIHYLLDCKGKHISVMMPYSAGLYGLADWYRQLWAESLGKQHGLRKKNVFAGQTPVKALGVTDQHSQLQLYSEGPSNKIITFLEVERFMQKLPIPDAMKHVEPLKYLAGCTFQQMIHSEKIATEYALLESRRPTTTVVFPRVTAETVGQFLYMYEVSVSYMGALMDINPYDQPAVQLGKDAACALMGKTPHAELEKKIAAMAQKDRKFML